MRRLPLVLLSLAFAAGATACGGGGETGSPRVESDDGVIAFASQRDGDFDVYVMRPDGSSVRNLTRNESTPESEADDDNPVWSPDGAMIAFQSTRDHPGDGAGEMEIYVMRADGTAQRRLTHGDRPYEYKFPPRWIDDEHVGFTACTFDLGTCDLVAVRADGSAALDVREEGHPIHGVAPSPDASLFAYLSRGDIWIRRSDGTARRRLTTSRGDDFAPIWSPDGTAIAFLSQRDRNGECMWHDCVGWNSELYVIDSDGRNERRLTDDPGDELAPTWSPDGTRIVFSSHRDGNDYELYVLNVDGTCLTQLTDNGEWDWSPSWWSPSRRGAGPLRC